MVSRNHHGKYTQKCEVGKDGKLDRRELVGIKSPSLYIHQNNSDMDLMCKVIIAYMYSNKTYI